MGGGIDRGGLSFGLFAVVGRRDAHLLAEQAREVEAVVDADFVADLVDFHVGLIEQAAGHLDAELVQAGDGGLAGTGAEEADEVRGRVSYLCGDLADGQFTFDVALHEENGRIDDVVLERRLALADELAGVAERGQQVVEYGRGVMEVVVAVAPLQRAEDRLEQVDAVVGGPAPRYSRSGCTG